MLRKKNSDTASTIAANGHMRAYPRVRSIAASPASMVIPTTTGAMTAANPREKVKSPVNCPILARGIIVIITA